MVRFLFWNTNQQQRAALLAELCTENNIDLVVIAENGASPTVTVEALNWAETLYRYHRPPYQGSADEPRVQIYSRFPRDCIKSVSTQGTVEILAVAPPVEEGFTLVAAHLSSKRNLTSEDQADLAARLRPEIEEAEEEAGHTRTVVVGDLNMSPFERGLVSCECFHAVMCKRTAASGSRTVRNATRTYFYNPMWSQYCRDDANAPGTYYYHASRPMEYFWHIYDQVLIRPSLIPAFQDSKLQILTSVGEKSLLTKNGVPSKSVGSDHLPVVFELDLTQGKQWK